MYMRTIYLALVALLLSLPVYAKSYEVPNIDDSHDVGMRPEWFACGTDADCGLTTVTCGFAIAANIHHLQEVHRAYCKQAYGCVSSNCPTPPIVIAVCEVNSNRQSIAAAAPPYCVTKDNSPRK